MIMTEFVRVTVNIPKQNYDALEKLVDCGEYGHVSEAIRAGIRLLLQNCRERGLIK